MPSFRLLINIFRDFTDCLRSGRPIRRHQIFDGRMQLRRKSHGRLGSQMPENHPEQILLQGVGGTGTLQFRSDRSVTQRCTRFRRRLFSFFCPIRPVLLSRREGFRGFHQLHQESTANHSSGRVRYERQRRYHEGPTGN